MEPWAAIAALRKVKVAGNLQLRRMTSAVPIFEPPFSRFFPDSADRSTPLHTNLAPEFVTANRVVGIVPSTAFVVFRHSVNPEPTFICCEALPNVIGVLMKVT